jgi:hypothetical protein
MLRSMGVNLAYWQAIEEKPSPEKNEQYIRQMEHRIAQYPQQGVCLLQKCISRVRLSLYWPAAPRGDKYEGSSLLPPPTVYHLAR